MAAAEPAPLPEPAPQGGTGAGPDGHAGSEEPALDRTLAALADPFRRRTVELLGTRPHRAGELARALGVTPSVMSKHLRVLRSSGLVAEEHPPFDARVRIYSLQSAPMRTLRSWVEDTERGWAEQLTAFRRHLEDRPLDDRLPDGRQPGDRHAEGGGRGGG
jgi:DNA-binding transcriptional ArsR family regulator